MSDKTHPLTLAEFDVLPPPAPADEWEETRNWTHAAVSFEKGKLAAQVMAGFGLESLKKKHGETRGRPGNKPNDSVYSLKPQTWADLVKEKCGITDDTARCWIDMSRVAAARLKKLPGDGRAAFRLLMELPINQWSDEQLTMLTTVVTRLTDGKTQLDFLGDLYKTPRKLTGGANGGNTHPGPMTHDEAAEEALHLIVLPARKALEYYDHKENGIPLGAMLREADAAELDAIILDLSQRRKAAKAEKLTAKSAKVAKGKK